MALRQTLHVFTGTNMETPTRCASRVSGAALTAPWPGRRSPGPRYPFCSAPSAAPAAWGWASLLPRPGLRGRQSSHLRGAATAACCPHSQRRHQQETPVTPSKPARAGSSLPPTSGPHAAHTAHTGAHAAHTAWPPYLLHTGWSSAERGARQTRSSHRPPAGTTDLLCPSPRTTPDVPIAAGRGFPVNTKAVLLSEPPGSQLCQHTC